MLLVDIWGREPTLHVTSIECSHVDITTSLILLTKSSSTLLFFTFVGPRWQKPARSGLSVYTRLGDSRQVHRSRRIALLHTDRQSGTVCGLSSLAGDWALETVLTHTPYRQQDWRQDAPSTLQAEKDNIHLPETGSNKPRTEIR